MPKTGGQIQLLAEGNIENFFLNGNPNITAFKKIFKRHTRFAIDNVSLYFDGTPSFGQKVVCEIPKCGDLLGQLFLGINLPKIKYADGTPAEWVNSIGHALIQEVSIEIGEEQIDRHTGEWMEMWTQLTIPSGKLEAFNAMIGCADGLGETSYDISGKLMGPMNLMVPLHFWFCGDTGMYLPICAIQHHRIRVVLTIRPLEQLYRRSNPTAPCPDPNPINPTNIVDLKLWADFIHLSVEERRRFVSTTHDYIIEQLQYTPPISISPNVSFVTVPLEFKHAVKEFFWYIKPDRLVTEPLNFSSLSAFETGIRKNIMASATLQLDGCELISERDANYFRIFKPFQAHTRTPINRYIYCFPLGLQPESNESDTTLNLSEIGSVNFLFNIDNSVVPERGFCTTRIYAKNFNVIRVVEGMVGLLFRG
jgi:hypothetical protein